MSTCVLCVRVCTYVCTCLWHARVCCVVCTHVCAVCIACTCVGEFCACATSACICVCKPQGTREPGFQRVWRVDGLHPLSPLVCAQGWCSGLLAGTTCAQNHPAPSPDPLTGGAEHPGGHRTAPDGPHGCTAGRRNAGRTGHHRAMTSDQDRLAPRASVSPPGGGGLGRVPWLVCVAVAETHQRPESRAAGPV